MRKTGLPRPPAEPGPVPNQTSPRGPASPRPTLSLGAVARPTHIVRHVGAPRTPASLRVLPTMSFPLRLRRPDTPPSVLAGRRPPQPRPERPLLGRDASAAPARSPIILSKSAPWGGGPLAPSRRSECLQDRGSDDPLKISAAGVRSAQSAAVPPGDPGQRPLRVQAALRPQSARPGLRPGPGLCSGP